MSPLRRPPRALPGRALPRLAAVLALLAAAPAAAAGEGKGPRATGLPVQFVANRGQLPAPALFEARVPGMRFRAERAALRFELAGGERLGLVFEGASEGAFPVGEEAGATYSFLHGPRPAEWVVGAPAWTRLRTNGLYRGVDLEVHARLGRIEYDLILAPGVDLDEVRVRCEGHTDMAVGVDGALVLRAGEAALVQEAPLAWQIEPDGARRELRTHYRILEGERFTLVVEGRDPSLFTVVDPVVAYTTYVGGSGGDEVHDVAIDPLGMVYGTGWTGSGDFPVTRGSLAEERSNEEAFVFKLDPTGKLVWATYLGGARADRGLAVGVDESGEVVVAGRTSSSDFPTTAQAFARERAGGQDAFVLKLTPTGSALVWSTYLGGGADDEARAVALDRAGVAHVAGATRSSDFPTHLAGIQAGRAGERDAFVTRLAFDGSGLELSTYLGGKGQDEANALAIDEEGALYVAGRTASSDFPISAGAHDALESDVDAFVAKLVPGGASLAYSTFLGGRDEEEAFGLAVDTGLRAHVVGATRSPDFPVTPDALIAEFPGARDGFYAVVNATGSALVHGTYLGGHGRDEAFDVALDAYGTAWIVGRTASDDFPVTPDALQAARSGAEDAFVVEIDAQRELAWGSYLGGSGDDRARAVAVEPFLRVTAVAGAAKGGLVTTPGVAGTKNAGGLDGFVTRLNHGFCGEPGRVHVLARGCGAALSGDPPRLGKTTALRVSGGPPHSEGFLLISDPGAAPRNLAPGCDVFVDLSSYQIMTLFVTDAEGSFEYPISVISSPTQCGLAMVIQGAVISSAGPLPFGAMTDALLVRLGD